MPPHIICAMRCCPNPNSIAHGGKPREKKEEEHSGTWGTRNSSPKQQHNGRRALRLEGTSFSQITNFVHAGKKGIRNRRVVLAPHSTVEKNHVPEIRRKQKRGEK
uniref:Uncharacterized protein n=1 Tax=Trypanosoma congolense (strain IL3000) TaxID=1068625 RepID=G0URW3_TRYCI|nr:hypothetical protein, unlikely [Trypanosoma congolense IL3000]